MVFSRPTTDWGGNLCCKEEGWEVQLLSEGSGAGSRSLHKTKSRTSAFTFGPSQRQVFETICRAKTCSESFRRSVSWKSAKLSIKCFRPESLGTIHCYSVVYKEQSSVVSVPHHSPFFFKQSWLHSVFSTLSFCLWTPDRHLFTLKTPSLSGSRSHTHRGANDPELWLW